MVMEVKEERKEIMKKSSATIMPLRLPPRAARGGREVESEQQEEFNNWVL